eukprot:EG_transcript_23611
MARTPARVDANLRRAKKRQRLSGTNDNMTEVDNNPVLDAASAATVEAIVKAITPLIEEAFAPLNAIINNRIAAWGTDIIKHVANELRQPEPRWRPRKLADFSRMTCSQARVLEQYYQLKVGRAGERVASFARRRVVASRMGVRLR